MNSKLSVLSLFAGIGGFDLGLERTGGFKTVAFCEIDPFCRRVLAKHWPEVPCYDDVRTLTAERLAADGIAVDVICGGFPCQDISLAGSQAGLDGRRSGLWSEIVRLSRDLRPRYILVENVANLLSGPSNRPGAWFARVLGDLAEIGYDAEWNCIPASAVGAPHIRDRVWIIAQPQHPDTDSLRPHRAAEHDRRIQPRDEQGRFARSLCPALADADRAGFSQRAPHARGSGAAPDDDARHPAQRGGSVADAYSIAPIGTAIARQERRPWLAEPDVGRVAPRVPARVDRLRALGNAVVPQVVEVIGRAILQAEAA